jgi:large subunit ribosomal protein L23
MQGKVRRMGRHVGRRPNWKKARVKLREGDTIEFFEGV